jgi:hypothetical protein
MALDVGTILKLPLTYRTRYLHTFQTDLCNSTYDTYCTVHIFTEDQIKYASQIFHF